MPNDSRLESEGLISRKDYILGRISVALRLLLPSVRKAYKQVQQVDQTRESWGAMLERNAQRYPNNIALKSEESILTYREYNQWVNRYANYFISQGLKKSDTAIIFLENRPELLIVYSAMAKIGAINSMINTNLRRDSLLHCMRLNPGKVFIVGEEVIDAFEEIRADLDLREGQATYFVPDRGQKPAPHEYIDLSEAVKSCEATNPSTTGEMTPKDALAYVFTSGTTGGMPKAAVVTHGRTLRCMYFVGNIVLNMKPSDTFYVPLPFFHTNALALSWPCVFAKGAALAIRRKFSASKFLDDVRKFDATIFCYVGELCRYLMNQPPKRNDRDNPLKKILGNGLRPDIWKAFKNRFAISQVYEIYGAAESNIFFINLYNLDCTIGTSFMPYAIVKYDIDQDEPIRDENGFMQRVEVGETGLVIGEISESNPFTGYTNTEATESKVLRNVFTKEDAWFNSGDLLRDIGYNHAQFVDRLGDTFRWKGENVSTTEVEKVANSFPHISLSAVYGVLMPAGDGRAGMAAILADTKTEEFDLKGLAEHFLQALPSYAVPRFIRFKTQFEYTPTHKIKKVELKREGFDPAKIPDPLYVLLPGENEYKLLTVELHAEIVEGKHKF